LNDIESSLFPLSASHRSYLLEVIFFSIDTSKLCNYFHFELALAPKTRVMDELLCPIIIYTPPTDISFSAGHDVSIHRDDYVFTAAQINSTVSTFRYPIELNVVDSTTLSVEIGFNFLANDFRLFLRDHNGFITHTGQPRGSEDRDSYINFYHFLRAQLDPGESLSRVRCAMALIDDDDY